MDGAREPLGAYPAPPSRAARVAAGVLLIVVGLVALLVLLGALIVALPTVIVLLTVASIRGRIVRARGPGGLLDGRRNVRVVIRDSAA